MVICYRSALTHVIRIHTAQLKRWLRSTSICCIWCKANLCLSKFPKIQFWVWDTSTHVSVYHVLHAFLYFHLYIQVYKYPLLKKFTYKKKKQKNPGLIKYYIIAPEWCTRDVQEFESRWCRSHHGCALQQKTPGTWNEQPSSVLLLVPSPDNWEHLV